MRSCEFALSFDACELDSHSLRYQLKQELCKTKETLRSKGTLRDAQHSTFHQLSIDARSKKVDMLTSGLWPKFRPAPFPQHPDF